MNRAEAKPLLLRMAKAWDHDVTTDELEVWFEASLANVDAAVAFKAMMRLIATDKRWPSPARFNEMRRAVEADEIPDDRQLQAGPRTTQERENVARFIALCREVLAARDKRNHWHGGPNPCEVCGGIDPNLGAKKKRAARIRAQADTLRKMHTGRDRKPYDSPAPWNEQELTPLRDDTVVVQKDQS